MIPDLIITSKIKNSDCNDFQIWNRMIQGNLRYDALMIGSSRSWVHYDPRILDSALDLNSYNLGRDGKKMDVILLSYDIYIEHNQMPKLVLCDIYHNTMGKSDPYDKLQFYPFLFNKEIWEVVHLTHKIRNWDRLIPMLKYYDVLDGIDRLDDEFPHYKGYHGFDKRWDGTELKKIDVISYVHDTNVLAMTNQWLYQCQQQGVQVVFVHSPMYIGATNKIDDTAAMWAMYRNLANQYNIPILDYSHDSICYDTNFFYNALHLNRKGAERFTRQLAHDLDSMGYGNRENTRNKFKKKRVF